jgi:hypothetical protein
VLSNFPQNCVHKFLKIHIQNHLNCDVNSF